MIAEVNGLADLLIAFSKFLMTALFTKNMLSSVLVEYIGTIQPDEKLDQNQDPFSPAPSLITRASNQLQKRVKLKLSLWQALISGYLPRCWRSESTNRLLDLAAATLDRLEGHLDIATIIQTQHDVQDLLDNFMTQRRQWLFRQSKSRLMSIPENQNE
jgi:hypothetical protein